MIKIIVESALSLCLCFHGYSDTVKVKIQNIKNNILSFVHYRHNWEQLFSYFLSLVLSACLVSANWLYGLLMLFVFFNYSNFYLSEIIRFWDSIIYRLLDWRKPWDALSTKLNSEYNVFVRDVRYYRHESVLADIDFKINYQILASKLMWKLIK